MKKIFSLLLSSAFFFNSVVQAQQTCFNFDDSIIGTQQNKENAIDLFRGVGQPLEGWTSVGGSPSIFSTTSINFPSGKQCLLLGACGSNKSEGASYNYAFKSGKNYEVTFKYRYYSLQAGNATLSNFDVLLADSLVHNNQGGCGTISTVAISPAAKNIFSKTNYSDTAWKTATIQVSGLTKDYSQIWWRVNIPQAIAAAPYLLIDDVCLKELAPPTCFHFDDSIIGTLQNKENAIDLYRGVGQPLEGWTSVNGSPSIYSSPSINFPSGKQCLLLGACGSNKSEGASYNYAFKSGKSYEVSFKYRYYSLQTGNAALSNFDVLLADSLVHNNQGGCGTVSTFAISPAAKNIFSKTNYSDTAWKTATIQVSGLTKDYSQIWWRINIPQAIAAAPYLLIDDVCLQEGFLSGINEFSESENALLLYPNPASKEVFVQFNSELDLTSAQLKLYDMMGAEIKNIQATNLGNKIRIETSDLKAGNYLVRLSDNEGQIYTKHLVIVR
jgi:hypothetical protein